MTSPSEQLIHLFEDAVIDYNHRFGKDHYQCLLHNKPLTLGHVRVFATYGAAKQALHKFCHQVLSYIEQTARTPRNANHEFSKGMMAVIEQEFGASRFGYHDDKEAAKSLTAALLDAGILKIELQSK